MATITLDVPDELADRLCLQGQDLASLLTDLLDPLTSENMSSSLRLAATHPVYREMIDFLATSPSSRQVMEFQLSDIAQERLSELLEKNREEILSKSELAELDVYELVHHSIIRLKAQARRSLR